MTQLIKMKRSKFLILKLNFVFHKIVQNLKECNFINLLLQKMGQSKFSTYILLIGMILIIYNTALMIFNIGYQLIFLIASLMWAVLKIGFNAVSNYPLTLLIFLLIISRNKNNRQTDRGGRNFLIGFLMKVFANNQECSICLQDKVNKVLPQCGHFYHRKCVDPWIRKSQQCPFCRATVLKTTLNYGQRLSVGTLKCLFKNNTKKIIISVLFATIVGIQYSIWWQNVRIFNQQNISLSANTINKYYCPSPQTYFIQTIKSSSMKWQKGQQNYNFNQCNS